MSYFIFGPPNLLSAYSKSYVTETSLENESANPVTEEIEILELSTTDEIIPATTKNTLSDAPKSPSSTKLSPTSAPETDAPKSLSSTKFVPSTTPETPSLQSTLPESQEWKPTSLTKSQKKDLIRNPSDVQNVLVVCEYRSGSTFVSEIFNQSPFAFYVYEPLSVLNHARVCKRKYGYCKDRDFYWKGDESKTLDEMYIQILQDYFKNKKLPWANKFIQREWTNSVGRTIANQWEACLDDGICNRGRDRILLEDFCPERDYKETHEILLEKFQASMNKSASEIRELDYGSYKTPGALRREKLFASMAAKEAQASEKVRRQAPEIPVDASLIPHSRVRRREDVPCSPIPEKEAEKSLAKKPLTTAKVVRLRRLKHLQNFTENVDPEGAILGDPNLEIFYLVRDPRGMANSRIHMEKTEENMDNAADLLAEICDRYRANLKFMLNHSYKNIQIIRYEDIVVEPFRMAKAVLKSVGHEMPERLIQWYNLNMGWKRSSGAYGTAREEPLKVAFGWRQQLALKDLNNVQKNCKHVMKMLGYNLVDEKNLKNDSFYTTDPNWENYPEYASLMKQKMLKENVHYDDSGPKKP